MKLHERVAILALVAVSLTACWATKAPEVQPVPASALSGNGDGGGSSSGSGDLSSSPILGTEADSAQDYGRVTVDLRARSGERYDWVYWKAGDSAPIYLPDASFVSSQQWSLRISTGIPILATNGGAAKASLHKGLQMGAPNGQSATALLNTSVPGKESEARAIALTDDVYDYPSAAGLKLSRRHHSPLLNQLGTGLLASYNGMTHEYKLSGNSFLLKTADGTQFYIVRFYQCDLTGSMTLKFEWKRVKRDSE